MGTQITALEANKLAIKNEDHGLDVILRKISGKAEEGKMSITLITSEMDKITPVMKHGITSYVSWGEPDETIKITAIHNVYSKDFNPEPNPLIKDRYDYFFESNKPIGKDKVEYLKRVIEHAANGGRFLDKEEVLEFEKEKTEAMFNDWQHFKNNLWPKFKSCVNVKWTDEDMRKCFGDTRTVCTTSIVDGQTCATTKQYTFDDYMASLKQNKSE